MNRTVVITGGSRGLGEKITRAFHAAGDRVAILSRTDTGLAKELGDRAKFFPVDISRTALIQPAIEAVREWAGDIGVLINNAGYSAWKPLDKIDEDFWDVMIGTNLKGLLFACKYASASMHPGAAIVNISSLAGKRGSANNSVYCASKFGVNGITQALAKELGVKGIRVNAVCPVYLRTEGLEDALNQSDSPAQGQDLGSFLGQFAKTQTAMGVLPTEQQVADTCVFLASSAAGAITGQCINVDCGVLPQ
ncbi:MAG: SDR family oxidoreductase [Chitinophagaceae bacterium]|nr:SDR family oxidoreductase [Chitinophagaceae bacterium]